MTLSVQKFDKIKKKKDFVYIFKTSFFLFFHAQPVSVKHFQSKDMRTEMAFWFTLKNLLGTMPEDPKYIGLRIILATLNLVLRQKFQNL